MFIPLNIFMFPFAAFFFSIVLKIYLKRKKIRNKDVFFNIVSLIVFFIVSILVSTYYLFEYSFISAVLILCLFGFTGVMIQLINILTILIKQNHG